MSALARVRAALTRRAARRRATWSPPPGPTWSTWSHLVRAHRARARADRALLRLALAHRTTQETEQQ